MTTKNPEKSQQVLQCTGLVQLCISDLGYVHIDISMSTSPGFRLRLVQASPVRVRVYGQLYEDNSTHVYQQSPVGLKSNRENALRKKLQYTTTSLTI